MDKLLDLWDSSERGKRVYFGPGNIRSIKMRNRVFRCAHGQGSVPRLKATIWHNVVVANSLSYYHGVKGISEFAFARLKLFAKTGKRSTIKHQVRYRGSFRAHLSRSQ